MNRICWIEQLFLKEEQNMLNTKIKGLADMAEDWDWPDDEW